MSLDHVEKSYKKLIAKAIEQGKLFELLFGENAEQLWQGIPERHKHRWVREVLEARSIEKHKRRWNGATCAG